MIVLEFKENAKQDTRTQSKQILQFFKLRNGFKETQMQIISMFIMANVEHSQKQSP